MGPREVAGWRTRMKPKCRHSPRLSEVLCVATQLSVTTKAFDVCCVLSKPRIKTEWVLHAPFKDLLIPEPVYTIRTVVCDGLESASSVRIGRINFVPKLAYVLRSWSRSEVFVARMSSAWQKVSISFFGCSKKGVSQGKISVALRYSPRMMACQKHVLRESIEERVHRLVDPIVEVFVVQGSA